MIISIMSISGETFEPVRHNTNMCLQSLQHISRNILGHYVRGIPRAFNLSHPQQAPKRVAIDLPAVLSVCAITLTFFASFDSSNIDRTNNASDTP